MELRKGSVLVATAVEEEERYVGGFSEEETWGPRGLWLLSVPPRQIEAQPVTFLCLCSACMEADREGRGVGQQAVSSSTSSSRGPVL